MEGDLAAELEQVWDAFEQSKDEVRWFLARHPEDLDELNKYRAELVAEREALKADSGGLAK